MVGSGEVPRVRPLSYVKIELFAQEVIRRHYPERLTEPGPLDILDFFEFVLPTSYGIDTGVSSRLPVGIEGVTLPGQLGGRASIVIPEHVYVGMEHGVGRDRFTGAHESGHGLLHVRQLKTALVSGTFGGLHREMSIERYRSPEWQSDAFAGALLAPAPAVAAAVRRYGLDIAKLSSIFRISLTAMEVRLRVLRREGRM